MGGLGGPGPAGPTRGLRLRGPPGASALSRGRKLAIALPAAALLFAAAVAEIFRSDRGVPVRIHEVSTRDIVASVTASGRIHPHRRVGVHSDLSGSIRSLFVQPGDVVQAGDPLLRIETEGHEAELTRTTAMVSGARSRVARHRAEVLHAEQTLRRATALRSSSEDFLSLESLEEHRLRLEVERALLCAALHAVEEAEAQHRETVARGSRALVRAPIPGTVMEVGVVAGERALGGPASSPASPLLTIGDVSQVEAVVEVPETDVRALSVGDSAWIELDALPGHRLPAALARIGEAAAPRSPGDGDGRVGFAVTLTLIDPPAGLRPGLSAVAEIIVDRRREVIAVPIISATVRDFEPGVSEAPVSRTPADAGSPEEGVFRIRGGRAVWSPIELGIGGQEYFEVLSGIVPGDTVVAGPYETIRALRDGDPVQATANPVRAAAEPITPY